MKKNIVMICFILSIVVLILLSIYVSPYAIAGVGAYCIVWPCVLMHTYKG
jgi:hypothetical protein